MRFELLPVAQAIALFSTSVLASGTSSSNFTTPGSLGILRFNPGAEDMHTILARAERETPQWQGFVRAKRSVPSTSESRSTPSNLTPRAGTPPGPSAAIIGYLHIRNALDGTSLGYAASAFNSFGEYGPTTSSQRLKVSIDTSMVNQAISIMTTNGQDADLLFMVGITGFSNDASGLNTGKYNYVYVGAGGQTAVNVSPRSGDNSFSRATGNPEGIESAILTLLSNQFVLQSNFDIVPFWINGDGSKPNTSLGLHENVLFLTGDQDIFVKTFGSVTWVILSFEPELN
ncbi:hypothetical protein F5890DRAFT_1475715 [Lentinula detonsa]|uniref:Uncharacterized protein n=1 Tax=Lentinula detonsa TaxID=2804962 RepID=A0AA38PWN6_9AGAR|nr:hypothetical protein F5890DRAFT_1475715 [Lentinula detonsa]